MREVEKGDGEGGGGGGGEVREGYGEKEGVIEESVKERWGWE